MNVYRDIDRRIARIERLLGRRMGVREGGLALRVKRLRSELPKAVRRDALALVEARHLSGHPKIARQLDRKGLARAEKRISHWLRGPELRERRLTRRIRWASGMVVNLALLGAVVFWLV